MTLLLFNFRSLGMGAFVLGILVGWLLEWAFFTFWVKTRENDDCSSLKAELELKNKQISSLQSQLSSSTASTNTTKSSLMSDTTTNKSSAKVNKTTSKSTPAKSASTSKKSTAKASLNKSSAKKSSPAKKKKSSAGDDLTKVEGIGPKASGALKDAGINSFEKLANSKVAVIQKILDESDGRFGMMNPGSWPKQAKMAADGKWDQLKKWQDEHDGGLE